MKFKNFLRTGISLFAFFVLTQAVFAIGVSPAKTELTMDPGQTKTITIRVHNNTDEDMDNVVTEVEAFSGNNEKGSIFADEELLKNQNINIEKWITYSDTGFEIKKRESKEVTITIIAPEKAEPGGKYVSILFSQRPNSSLDGTGVVVIARAASLVFLTVSGDIIESGEIEKFELPEELKSDEEIPFTVVFKNTGNVHVKPIGDIRILDKNTGKELVNTGTYKDTNTGESVISKTIPINYVKGNVLPNSIRNFISPWVQNFQNGEFTVIASVEYGDEKKAIDKQLEFEINESVNVDKFNINILPTSADFTLTITNTGNIIERLTGHISITNYFKYEVAKIDLPEDLEYIKPGETKTYTFDWIQTEIPKGLYTATLEAKLGLTKADVTASVQFGHMTYGTYAIIGSLALLVLLLLFLLLRRRKQEKKEQENKEF